MLPIEAFQRSQRSRSIGSERSLPASKLEAEKAREASVGKGLAVTFGLHPFRSERQVPQGREERMAVAIAKTMRALAAHAGGCSRLRDVARAGECFEETKLAFGSPAVP